MLIEGYKAHMRDYDTKIWHQTIKNHRGDNNLERLVDNTRLYLWGNPAYQRSHWIGSDCLIVAATGGLGPVMRGQEADGSLSLNC